MPRSHRERARLIPSDLTRVLYRTNRGTQADLLTGWEAHRRQHGQDTILYTSKATIDTTASTPFTPLFAGRLVRARLNVATAPSGGNLVVDILFDGVSIFQSAGAEKLKVADGETLGRYGGDWSRDSFQADTKIQIQVTDVAGAGGPFVASLEYRPAVK